MENFNPSTWFVTGATGLVGSSIIELLQANELRVIALVRESSPTKMIKFLENLEVKLVYGDLLDPSTYEKYLPTCDVVVHAAAAVQNRNKDKNWEINLRGTKVLCEAMKNANVNRMIHISSSGVYGAHRKNPAIETDKLKPYGEYLKSKLAAENLILNEYPNISVTIIRPPFIIGDYDKDRHIVPSIIKTSRRFFPKIWRRNPKYGFAHAEDIARLVFIAGIKYSTPSSIYNIQSFELDFQSIFKMVNEVKGIDTKFIPIPYSLAYLTALAFEFILTLRRKPYSLTKRLPLTKNDWVLSTQRVRTELGFEPLHSDNNEFERVLGKYFNDFMNEESKTDIRDYMKEEPKVA